MLRGPIWMILAAAAATICLSGCGSTTEVADAAGPKILYYHDPMHPSYRSDKPGIAPDCGMKLVPVYADSAPSEVRVDPMQEQHLGIRVAPAEVTAESRTLRMFGRVEIEAPRLYVVNAPISGYFTKVGPSTGDHVHKGQVIGAYFARELRAASQAHLLVMDRLHASAEPDDATRIRSDRWNYDLSVETMHTLGVTDEQIQEIESTRDVPDEIVLRAPASGIVMARNGTLGQRFDRGHELYRIADLSEVWVVANLPAEDQSAIESGGAANVIWSSTAPPIRARIADSLPEFDPSARTLKLRLNVPNTNLVLKPDMLMDVEIPLRASSGLTVPMDAVLYTGAAKSVFLKTGEGRFERKPVETGWISGGRVNITKGLGAGDMVAVSGQFLLDSEARLHAGSHSSEPAK